MPLENPQTPAPTAMADCQQDAGQSASAKGNEARRAVGSWASPTWQYACATPIQPRWLAMPSIPQFWVHAIRYPEIMAAYSIAALHLLAETAVNCRLG